MVSYSNNNNMSKAKGIVIPKKKKVTVVRPNRGLGELMTSLNQVVMAPAAQNRSAGQTGGKSLRFKECERIATVNGSVAFAVTTSIPCNPAISTSFPWLSGHGALFERYRVHKIVYRYKNLKGTATNGNILMSFDYDTLDNSPATAIEMTQSTVYADGAPWRIFELAVPTDKRDLFTRAGAVVGSDLKTYDMGKLHVAAEGCADTTPHGYLEVEYDIELFMKQSVNSGGSSGTAGSALISLATDASVPVVSQNSLGVTITGTGPYSVSAPAGKFGVVLRGQSTGGTASTAAFSGTNLVVPSTIPSDIVTSDETLVTLAAPGSLGVITASGQKLIRIIITGVP